MDQQQIDRVRASYARIAPLADTVGAEFYRRLRARNPAAREKTSSDQRTQARKLMNRIGRAVNALDYPDRLLESCRVLGQRFADSGVPQAHYDDVGTALLQTLHAGLGDDYTDDVEEAWATLYAEMAETMMAAGQARSE